MAGVGRSRAVLKLALLVVLVGGALAAVYLTPLGEHVTQRRVLTLLETLRGSLWAPLVFVLAYTAATTLALPGSLLTIAGGAVFGFWWGSLLNTVGANLGANAAFGLGRTLGREGIEKLAGDRLAGLDKATARHGFIGLLTLRLIPLVPFNALNFGSGLTAMRWRDYALATVIGILPGTLVYTFSADALVKGATSASAEATRNLYIAAGLFLLLILVPIIARRLGFRPPSGASGSQEGGARSMEQGA